VTRHNKAIQCKDRLIDRAARDGGMDTQMCETLSLYEKKRLQVRYEAHAGEESDWKEVGSSQNSNTCIIVETHVRSLKGSARHALIWPD